ncbi:hypothetical protein YC2023_039272 [Brassica napus]
MGYLTGEKITKTTLQQTPLHARLSFKFTFSLSLVPALICSDDTAASFNKLGDLVYVGNEQYLLMNLHDRTIGIYENLLSSKNVLRSLGDLGKNIDELDGVEEDCWIEMLNNTLQGIPYMWLVVCV